MSPEPKEVRPIRWQSRDGSFDVTLRFAQIEGRMECVGIDVRPVGRHARILTAAALHSLPLGRLVEKRRKEAGDITTTLVPGRIVLTGQNLGTKITRRRGRPPMYPPEHWEDVAETYVGAYTRNRTPTRAVAKRFEVSESVAAKWVAKCRALGLLPQTRQGKARAVVDAPLARGRVRLRSTAKGTVPKAATTKKRRKQ